jgi:hypothetical protein
MKKGPARRTRTSPLGVSRVQGEIMRPMRIVLLIANGVWLPLYAVNWRVQPFSLGPNSPVGWINNGSAVSNYNSCRELFYRSAARKPNEDAIAAISFSAACFVATISALRPLRGASSKIFTSRFSLKSLSAIRTRVVS